MLVALEIAAELELVRALDPGKSIARRIIAVGGDPWPLLLIANQRITGDRNHGRSLVNRVRTADAGNAPVRRVVVPPVRGSSIPVLR